MSQSQVPLGEGMGLSRPLILNVFGDEFVSQLEEEEEEGALKEPKIPKTDNQGSLSLFKMDKLTNQMSKVLNELEDKERQELDSIHQEGRLGPNVVKIDVGSHVGSFIIGNDRLGVSSQCNFGSLRASTCVYKGRWQYEVQLGSNGIMQVGWATLESKFSQEKGVGDTIDSYSYDGNRVRKWNRVAAQYGETWQTGDIIGSCIDLDEGTLEFYRNGKSLGIAFKDVVRGPSVAYFPAISLAFQENLVLNFGATPLQFPVEGFSSLQSRRTAANTKCSLLLTWLENLLPLHKGPEPGGAGASYDYEAVIILTNKVVESLAPHFYSGFAIEQSFFPFFTKVLGLPPTGMGNQANASEIPDLDSLHWDKIEQLLDILWSFLEGPEVKECLERFCKILLSQFRSNSMTLEYPNQRYALLCLMGLMKHRKTRRHFIRNLLLDRSSRLVHFLHVRPVDESVINNSITPWWPEKEPESSPAGQAYKQGCESLQRQVSEVERLQVLLLKILLTNDDGTDKRPSSRALFLNKFRHHVREVIRPGTVMNQPFQKAICTFFCFLKSVAELYSEELEDSQSPFPSIPPALFYDTSLAYFEMERVGGLASFLYKAYHSEVAEKLSIPDYVQDKDKSHMDEVSSSAGESSNMRTVPARTAQVSTGVATDDSILTITTVPPRDIILALPRVPVSSNVPHASGLSRPPPASNSSSEESLGTVPQITGLGTLIGTPSGHNMLIPMMTELRNADNDFIFYPGAFMGLASVEHRTGSVQPQNPAVALLGKEFGKMDPLFSLREVLDDAIIVFNAGVISNIEKVVSLRSSMKMYQEALKSANDNLQSASTTEEEDESRDSISIFTGKLDELARHMAWIKSAVFTEERQTLVHELLKIVLNSLNAGSSEGNLFTFVPEHYVETLVQLNSLLLTHMHPTVPYDTIADIDDTFCQVAEFVATHFADPRLVIAETRDTLTQALGSYICNSQMLAALEKMSNESQLTMVKATLRPYENRAWAQSNWMLVRMWQGDGFAFQYPYATEARKPYQSKHLQDDFGIFVSLPPNPSKVFQNHIADILLSDQKFAVSFIHSVLNQLNWAFSECVGMLQDIQSVMERRERVFVESRQLKICCTCFELTHALLRVLEMVVCIAAPVLTDFTKEAAEPLLARLSMLLSQILNRIGSNVGSFANVIDLGVPGLENVQYFPIMSAVAGILVGLLQPEVGKEEDENEIPVTKTILGEPSFAVVAMDFFFGQNQFHVPEGRRVFSLQDYVPSDVSESELELMEKVVNHLKYWSEHLQPETDEPDDDHICPICYAFPINATLKPCNHRTCKSCIQHHLMNRGECFFCKSTIQQVFLDDGTKIYDIASSTSSTKSKSDPQNFP